MRVALLAALLLALGAASAGADRFLPEPTSCSHPAAAGFHHSYVGARYIDCAAAHHVVNDWLRTTNCHQTGYCRVLGGDWSCHTKYSYGAYHTHCTWLYSAGEVFTSWRRV